RNDRRARNVVSESLRYQLLARQGFLDGPVNRRGRHSCGRLCAGRPGKTQQQDYRGLAPATWPITGAVPAGGRNGNAGVGESQLRTDSFEKGPKLENRRQSALVDSPGTLTIEQGVDGGVKRTAG